ncbi:ferritin family protein [Haloimpatiens sp. FM7330]|uniref:ferritin family protein n=1 Tax=Haloimpatiens sp. FM7330 TaxID=3298610 RepID=UPI00362F529F
MSYTTKNGQPQGKACLYSNKIREDMISEIIAINGYEEHIALSDIEEINEVWHHIVEDEKRHYGMFLELLRKIDPIQYKKYEEVQEHLNLSGKHKYHKENIKSDKDLILNMVRDDIKGELEAVILYEEHVMSIPSKEVRKIYYEIINDEKEHLEELTLVLMKYDKDKYGPIE